MSQSQSTSACTHPRDARGEQRGGELALAARRGARTRGSAADEQREHAADAEHPADQAGLGEELERHVVRLADR